LSDSTLQPRPGIGRVVLLTAVLFSAAGGAAGYLVAHRLHSESAAEVRGEGDKSAEENAAGAAVEEDKTASVRTTPVRRGPIAKSLRAYGPVVARAGASRAVSAGFEVRVRRVLVVVGQHVDANTPLLRVEASPESKLQFAEARRAFAAAETDLKQVQNRIDLKLATNQDLSTAKQAVEAARLKLDSLHERGADAADAIEFKSDAAGIVAAMASQPGQLVAAGAPLVEIVPADQIEVRLGIAPADVRGVIPGQEVKFRPVGVSGAEPITGRVRVVSEKVSADTRLVDAFVSPAAGARLMLDEYVDAELPLPQREGLLVPRSAVLPDEDGYVMFTVKDGHAVRHAVTLLADDNRNALFEAKDVAEGDEAVVLGNFELEDKMKVAAQPAELASTEPASSEPSSQPTTEPAR
jgi:RND family efflux transporter MFP subunit